VIPVFEPTLTEEDVAAVVAALRRGEISGSFGEALGQFESEFAAYVGCRHAVAVSSGTTALHLAVAAAGIGAGDEVLVSASTNVATALAAYHNGAVPVPVDSEETTWNLDLDLVEGLVTPRTRALVPVHLYGHPVDMDRVRELARRHGAGAHDRLAGGHGLLQLLRQQGAHHRRGRVGHHQ
jgi:perosamine synthetase